MGWGALVQGDLKLDNLRLKPEALAQFNLPITVCAGLIGQLQLSIPWQALGRRPVVRSNPAPVPLPRGCCALQRWPTCLCASPATAATVQGDTCASWCRCQPTLLHAAVRRVAHVPTVHSRAPHGSHRLLNIS
jgi:hypothetical protein